MDHDSLQERVENARKPKGIDIRLIQGAKKSIRIVGLYDELDEYCNDLTSALNAIADACPTLLNDEGAPGMAERLAPDSSTEIPKGVEPEQRGRLRLAWGGS